MFYRIPVEQVFKPRDLGEAVKLLDELSGEAKVLAGGTDLILDLKIKRYTVKYLIDLSGLKQLKYIVDEGNVVRIGALTTIQEIADSPIISSKYPLIKVVADNFAYWQIRNVATIGGNLCNASPAADMAPPLMVYEALLKAVSVEGERIISITDFFKGPRQTVLKPNEILTEIIIPYNEKYVKYYGYCKIGRRRGHDISLSSVAVAADIDNGIFRDVRISFASMAPTPVRAYSVENALKGRAVDSRVIEDAVENLVYDVKPISDIRASAEYRLHVSKIILRDILLGFTERREV